jgi:hypothetical protein
MFRFRFPASAAGVLVAILIVVFDVREAKLHSRLAAANAGLYHEGQLISELSAEIEAIRNARVDSASVKALREEQASRQAERLELMRLRNGISAIAAAQGTLSARRQRAALQQRAIDQLTWKIVPPVQVNAGDLAESYTTNDLIYVGAEDPRSASLSYFWALRAHDVEAWSDLKTTADSRAAWVTDSDQAERAFASDARCIDGAKRLNLTRIEFHGEDQALVWFQASPEQDASPDAVSSHSPGSIQLKRIGEQWKVLMVSTAIRQK